VHRLISRRRTVGFKTRTGLTNQQIADAPGTKHGTTSDRTAVVSPIFREIWLKIYALIRYLKLTLRVLLS
jgi:hypothetical protein